MIISVIVMYKGYLIRPFLTLWSVSSVRARSVCPDPFAPCLLRRLLRPLILRLLVSSTLGLVCLLWHAGVCRGTGGTGDTHIYVNICGV